MSDRFISTLEDLASSVIKKPEKADKKAAQSEDATDKKEAEPNKKQPATKKEE